VAVIGITGAMASLDGGISRNRGQRFAGEEEEEKGETSGETTSHDEEHQRGRRWILADVQTMTRDW